MLEKEKHYSKFVLLLLLVLCSSIAIAQNQIHFSGFIDNSPSKFEIGEVDKPNDTRDWQKVKIRNGQFSIVIPANKPGVYRCYFKHKEFDFYASPGDSITINADYKNLSRTIKFSGKGKATAQFHTEWKRNFRFLHRADFKNREIKIPEEYLDIRQNLKEKDLRFLNDYAEKNGLKDSRFYNYYRSDFQFKFYSSISSYIQKHNNIEENGVKSEFQPLVELLDNINFKELDYLETESSQWFYVGYINMIKYRQLIYNNTLPLATVDSRHWLGRTYELSQEILPKEAFETYIMTMLFEFLNPVLVNKLTPIYDRFIKVCSIDNRIKLYKGFKKDKFRKKHEIPTDSYIKTADGGLKGILSAYKGSVVYVDFWASWCAPCISELPASKEIQGKFKDENIKFIFISIDKNESSWKKAIASYNIPGIHYRLDRKKSPELLDELLSKGVPHHIIVDTEGNIIDKNAKKPSDPNLIADLQKSLNK